MTERVGAGAGSESWVRTGVGHGVLDSFYQNVVGEQRSAPKTMGTVTTSHISGIISASKAKVVGCWWDEMQGGSFLSV
jgi:hypothetical protein